MQQLEAIIDRARRNAGEQRLAAVGELKVLANSGDSRHEAVSAMIRLWREAYVTPADLTPYAATVLELWRSVFERVKPFQQETASVEWIMDDEYAPASSEAETLLALLGHLPGEEIGQCLREALQRLTDPSLKMCALIALLRRFDPVTPSEIRSEEHTSE